MNKIVQSTIFGLVASSVILATTIVPAFAQYGAPSAPRETIIANRCSIATDRVNILITRIQSHQGRWTEVKTRLQTANQKITAYLQSNNPDALSQYQTLENTFANSLTQLQTDGQNLYTAILKIQTDANSGLCGSGNGTLKADLQNAKTLLQQFKADEQTSRSDFQAIKTYLQGLRTTVATPTSAM